MKNLHVLLAVSLLVSNALPSFAAPEMTPAHMKKRIAELEKENSQLKASLKSKGSSSSTTTASSSAKRVAFSDIGDSFASKYIEDLRQLGVFDGMGSEFKPNDPISRAEFVKWMVSAANAMFPPGKGVNTRLADGGTPSFDDVPTSHPYYRYIQGLKNTGFVVGYEDKDFRPDQMLTREEMIAIKTPFDMQGIPLKRPEYATPEYVAYFWRFDDSKLVSPKYCLAFANEHYSTGKNIERTFGNTRIFRPQEPVTRAEAAACIWQFGPKESNTQNQYWPTNAAVIAKAKARKGTTLTGQH
jgi:hypothetical protein